MDQGWTDPPDEFVFVQEVASSGDSCRLPVGRGLPFAQCWSRPPVWRPAHEWYDSVPHAPDGTAGSSPPAVCFDQYTREGRIRLPRCWRWVLPVSALPLSVVAVSSRRS